MKRLVFAAIAASCSIVLAACSNAPESARADGATNGENNSSEGYAPVTINACGWESTLTEVPENVIFVNSTGAPAMAALDVLDHVQARIGIVETSTYDDETKRKFDEIPVLGSANKGNGHFDVSTETLLEQEPDLILGSNVADFDVDKLQEAGIPMFIPEAYCGKETNTPASFEDIYDELTLMGDIFNVSDEAGATVENLRSRIGAIEQQKSSGTAAAVFLTPGDDRIYTYGIASMVTTQLKNVGLENIYGDTPKRVWEVSLESLLDQDPDHIVILYQENEQGTVDAFLEKRGTSEMRAVREGRVISMPYSLTDPPSPLSVDGAEFLSSQLK